MRSLKSDRDDDDEVGSVLNLRIVKKKKKNLQHIKEYFAASWLPDWQEKKMVFLPNDTIYGVT